MRNVDDSGMAIYEARVPKGAKDCFDRAFYECIRTPRDIQAKRGL